MKPLIGITSSRRADGTNTLSDAYVQAVIRAGGLAVMIPAALAESDYAGLRDRLDGILFSGGSDVDPACYGGTPHAEVYGIDGERDRLEIRLTQVAAQTDWPFLAICRGIQVANVALGGTLYTHIPDQLPGALQHDSDGPRDEIVHPVDVEAGSRLAGLLGATRVGANSFHHQGILSLAPAFKPVAFTSDGLVEGVELPGHRFGLGVQWHPECMPASEPMQRLFAAFIQAAGEDK